jgi:hypothetical protein
MELGKMKLLKGCVSTFLIIMLSACGGGGSGGGDSAGSSSVSTSANSLEVKSAYLYQAKSSFTVNLREAPTQSYYSYLLSDREDSIIYDTQANELSETQVEYVLTFLTGRELGYGTHQETLSVVYCYDEECNQPLEGMPVEVKLNVVVANHGAVVSDVDSINVSNPMSDEISLPEISMQIDIEGGVKDRYYFRYEDTAGIVVSGRFSGEVPATLNARLKADYQLGEGVYTSNLTIIACYDSACNYPVDTPLVIPVTYTIEGDSNTPTGYEVSSFLIEDEYPSYSHAGFDEANQRILLLDTYQVIDIESWTYSSFDREGYYPTKMTSNGTLFADNDDTDRYETYQLVNGRLVLQNSTPRISSIDHIEDDVFGDYVLFSRSDDNRFRVLDLNDMSMLQTDELVNVCHGTQWISSSVALTNACMARDIYLTRVSNGNATAELYTFSEEQYSCNYIPISIGISFTENGFESIDSCGQKIVGHNGLITRDPSRLSELEDVEVVSAYNGALLVRDNSFCGYFSSGHYISCKYRIIVLDDAAESVVFDIPYSSSLGMYQDAYYEPEKIFYSKEKNEIYLLTRLSSDSIGVSNRAIKLTLK